MNTLAQTTGAPKTEARRPSLVLKIALRLLLVLLTASTFLLVLGASMVPFHFRAGTLPIFLPLKCMMPAFIWGVCWASAVSAALASAVAWLFRRVRGRLGAAGWWIALIAAANLAATGTAAVYIFLVTASSAGSFAHAFGPAWRNEIPAVPARAMLAHRWSPFGFHDPGAHVERDVPFVALPGSGKPLLADVWLPPSTVAPSGLALLFFHGSSWHMADKGWGTDVMFRHLAAQGHVVMDVAYRLAPEVDLNGMVGDVKRAIVWMKSNGSRFHVDPDRIVVGGASAGGQIALLAAYAPTLAEFTPAELTGTDTSVRAAVAYYAPVDMRAFVNSELGKFASTGKAAPARKALTDPATHMPTGPLPLEQMMTNVMGGMPSEAPRAYDVADLRRYVTSSTPPTMLVQGEYDSVARIDSTRALVEVLQAARVPAVSVELRLTDHAFDVFTSFFVRFGVRFPFDSQYAPSTQAALYDLDRFLAVMASMR